MNFTVPANLEKFIEFNPNLLHIDFEVIRDDDEDFNGWFDTVNGDHTKYLFPFGEDASGGMFALWNPNGLAGANEFLVVFLGSEGDVAVPAENVDDFLTLLCTEHQLPQLILDGEEIHYREVMDEDLFEEIESDRKDYRDFLAKTCKLDPSEDYRDILERGSARLEEFEEWTEERIG